MMFRHIKREAFAMVLVALFLLVSPGLHASTLNYMTLTFTGVCAANDLCVGQGVGTLVVQDYTLGAELTTNNFVSFTYSSNYIPSMVITQATLSGVIENNLPSPEKINIAAFNGEVFLSGANGFWCTSTAPGGCADDMGTTSVWDVQQQAAADAVPEPGTIAFGLVGLGGLIWMRRRRTAPRS